MNGLLLRGLSIDWDSLAPDSYLRAIPALGFEGTLLFDSPVTCLVGENGSGKSTLLEGVALALGLNPGGGGRNDRFATCDSHSPLHEAIRLGRRPSHRRRASATWPPGPRTTGTATRRRTSTPATAAGASTDNLTGRASCI